MCEVSSVGEDYSTYFGGAPEERETEESELHKAIFRGFTSKPPFVGQHQIKPMDVTGSAQVKFDATWGGKEGPKYSVGVNGQVKNDKGAYLGLEAKKETGGEVQISGAAGIKKDGPGK